MKTLMIIVLTIFTINVANAGTVEKKIQSINSWLENEKSQTIKFQKVNYEFILYNSSHNSHSFNNFFVYFVGFCFK